MGTVMRTFPIADPPTSGILVVGNRDVARTSTVIGVPAASWPTGSHQTWRLGTPSYCSQSAKPAGNFSLEESGTSVIRLILNLSARLLCNSNRGSRSKGIGCQGNGVGSGASDPPTPFGSAKSVRSICGWSYESGINASVSRATSEPASSSGCI